MDAAMSPTPHVAWMSDCYAPDICSPVSNGEPDFSAGHNRCAHLSPDSQTGEVVYEEEIDDTFMASPTLAGEWLYLIGEEGTMHRMLREFEEENVLSLRSRQSLSRFP